MKKTEKMGLNLMESSDPFSATPLNENTTKLDAAVGANSAAVKEHGEAITSHGKTISSHSTDLSALKTAAAKIPGKAMMACGTYVGDGKSSVTILTPGFKATALIMRCLQDVTIPSGKVSEEQITYQSGDAECRGFTMWAGENLATRQWYENGTVSAPIVVTGYSAASSTIKFTPAVGTLSWRLSRIVGSTVYNLGANVNNEVGKTYVWVAFGTEVV